MFVCILPEKAVPEMTYTVSGGTLNPTHSLIICCMVFWWRQNADYMTAQVFDLTDKLEQSEAHLGRSGFAMGMDAAESSEDRLTKATKDRLAQIRDCSPISWDPGHLRDWQHSMPGFQDSLKLYYFYWYK